MTYNFRVVSRAEVKAFIEAHHYSHSINGLKVSFCYALYEDARMVGACLVGGLSTTSWKRYGCNEREVVELRRLVTLDDTPKNTESSFVAACLAHLKQNTQYRVVVSYADPFYGHRGVVYQAANFIYLGETSTDTAYMDVDTGKTYHSRALRTQYKGEYKPFVKRLREKYFAGKLREVTLPGKHIYVYPLRKTNRPRFNRIRQPYPKGEL